MLMFMLQTLYERHKRKTELRPRCDMFTDRITYYHNDIQFPKGSQKFNTIKIELSAYF